MRLLANAKTKHIVFLATAKFKQTLTMSLHKIPIIDFMILFFFLPEDVNSELVSQGSCGETCFKNFFSVSISSCSDAGAS